MEPTPIPIPVLGFSDPVSSWTHLLAAACAFFAAFLLLRKGRGNPVRLASLAVFSFSMIFLFSMSGVFHLLERGGVAREVFQRLDHAGIWALIAGTFTPVHVILFRGPWRWPILAVVWTLAITGLVLEVVFFDSFPEWLLLTFFLGLGWLIALSSVQFYRVFRDKSVLLLVWGGLFYSIGAILDFTRWPVFVNGVLGPHESFHLFVVAAAAVHWLFVYKWCDHPVYDTMTFHFHVLPDRRVIADVVDETVLFESASVEEAKQKTVDYVERKFHVSVRPKITIKYFRAESVEIRSASTGTEIHEG